jgi:hypothetical protein
MINTIYNNINNMPLSIAKLEKLLSHKSLIPVKYFQMGGICVYVEILSMNNADTILLYIPSKYKFPVDKTSSNVYKLVYLDINEAETSPDNFAGELDEYTIENTYGGNNNIKKDENFAMQLESNYKRAIQLKNVSNENHKELKDTYRQLKRLRFCVQDTPYKICIYFKNFLCSIQRDNSVEIYRIKKFKGDAKKRLFISTDLEHLYSSMDSILLNIQDLKKGIYHILDKNHFSHTYTLKRLLEEKNDIVQLSNDSYTKKSEYESSLEDSKILLKNLNDKEKKLKYSLTQIKNKFSSGNNLNYDINYSHQLSQIENEIRNIEKIRTELVDIILELRLKSENAMLNVDKIMFDNTVMIDLVLKNFSKLGEICIE